MNVTHWLNTPEFAAVAAQVDPVEFLDRLKLPKYLNFASGDEFFLPDDSHFYFDELLGPKHLRYVPDCEHSMAGHAVDVMYRFSFVCRALARFNDS